MLWNENRAECERRLTILHGQGVWFRLQHGTVRWNWSCAVGQAQVGTLEREVLVYWLGVIDTMLPEFK